MQDQLEFTGERFMPDIRGNIFLEHMHRYRMALRYCTGKDVLDIACGEGFGSDILAAVARSVIGVDISDAAVRHAGAQYRRDNLEFRTGSAADIPLPSASVDVVVSFETIEHISEHDAMLDEIRRVLRPGGVLVISTPDKATYTDATGLRNQYHVRELYRDQFESLLSSRFRHVAMHGQRIGFGSIIACETGAAPFGEDNTSNGHVENGLIDALYLIAVASDDPDAAAGHNSIFSENIMASEPVLVRVDAELAAERALSGKQRAIDRERFVAELGRRDQRIRTLIEEKASLGQLLGPDIARWQNELQAIQARNWHPRASLWRTVRRLLVSSLLYRLARIERFSDRRRARFQRSAEKRDPFRINRAIESFSTLFFARAAALRDDLTDTDDGVLMSLKVTAIVPNYNHAAFLRERLDSILEQSYPLVEVVILDDSSTDGSREIIEEYVSRFPDRVRAILNERNSGNVFAQWRKGHAAATGDLVWLCESDDFCDPDFLSRILPTFSDPSVTLAFGRIQFADSAGAERAGLDEYRNSAEPGIWDSRVKRPAHAWFSGAFGVKNLIANVGGSVWRRGHIRDEDWQIAGTFRIMGDWYLYSVVAGGGQIAYEPGAIAYFRIHGDNTSAGAAQKKPEYYLEYARLMTELRKRWNIPEATVDRFIASSREVFRAAAPQGTDFDSLVEKDALLAVSPKTPHILIGLLGFSYGGGELFPIHLANALHRRGLMVSVLQLMSSMDHPEVRRLLDPGIAVYRIDDVRVMGIRAFLTHAGVSLVHSHMASVEMILLDEGRATVPYVATLHGSHEAMQLPDSDLARWTKKIDRLVYTADRNLEGFRRVGVDASRLRKFRNAMPDDPLPFPQTRADLGISDAAVVFTLVARGEIGKGWPQAVRAFQELERRNPDRDIVLLMVGTGVETDAAIELAADNPRIRFLGFQQRIHGLYRISDVALVPTRFRGESFPLCLIQAMQVGIPAIATDIGEIRRMLVTEHRSAGLILARHEDDDAFVAGIVQAMEQILDAGLRSHLADCARELGESYSMDALADTYIDLYREVLSQA